MKRKETRRKEKKETADEENYYENYLIQKKLHIFNVEKKNFWCVVCIRLRYRKVKRGFFFACLR